MKSVWSRTLTGLAPASEEAERSMKRLGLGELCVCEIKRPRNLKWLRQYWLVVGFIAENMNPPLSKKAIDIYIKLRTGHKTVVTINGKMIEYADSISFDNMTQTEWEEYWPKAEEVVCSDLIPGLDRISLRKEALNLLQ